MKNDLMSTLESAEDCAPLGFGSALGEAVFTNTVSPEVCYRPSAVM